LISKHDYSADVPHVLYVAHAEVLDFNESQSLKKVQAHLESPLMDKYLWGQMEGNKTC